MCAPKSVCLVQYFYLGSSFCGSACVLTVKVVPVWRTSWISESLCICSSDVMGRAAAVSCCSWAKFTVLTGLLNELDHHRQLYFFFFFFISHQHAFTLPPRFLLPLSLCTKDSGSRRQWWGTYQCEPECRLVPLQAGTHINTGAHTDTFAVSSCLFPLSIQCLCLCLYPCERYQAEVNNVLSTIDLSGRSYGWEKWRGKWRGRDQCYSVERIYILCYTTQSDPLVFCSLIDYSSTLRVHTEGSKANTLCSQFKVSGFKEVSKGFCLVFSFIV